MTDKAPRASSAPTKPNGNPTPAAPPPDKQWSEVQLRRPFYSVAKCQKRTLQGYLLSSERINTMHGEREQLVFRLTAPTLAFRSSAKDAAPEEVQAGEEVTVMASADLARLAAKLRDDLVVEYRITPLERDAQISGNPWRFEIRANPKPIRRTVQDGLPRVALSAPAQGGEAPDDIPF